MFQVVNLFNQTYLPQHQSRDRYGHGQQSFRNQLFVQAESDQISKSRLDTRLANTIKKPCNDHDELFWSVSDSSV